MARKKKSASDNGIGHNSGDLSDDDISALSAYFSLRIRAQQRKAAVAKAAYDSERQEVNAEFKRVKAELKYDRKQFEEVLEKLEQTEAQVRADEAARTKRLSLAGVPVGTQAELPFGDTVDDKVEAFNEGYRAGRRGDDPTPIPENIHPMFHTDWQSGWAKGQEDNAPMLLRAEEIIAARKPEAILEAGEEGEDEFGEPSDEEAEFVEA